MVHKILVLVCVFAFVTEVYNKPRYKSDIQYCYKQECPENTFACEKSSRISEDKKDIISDIHCLDIKGHSLKKLTTYENNPYDPDTQFKGYSYTGSFHVSSDSDDNESPVISQKENRRNHKKSEVEDLNSR